MMTVPSLNLSLIEQTVVAAQTATTVKMWQTAINETALAMNIPTFTHTPGIRETQYSILESTVYFENPNLDISSVKQTVIARQAALATPTPDKLAIALEIEMLSTQDARSLGNSFWSLICVSITTLLAISYFVFFFPWSKLWKYLRFGYKSVFYSKSTKNE